MSLDVNQRIDVAGLAATINSRLAAEARIAKAVGFGWLCGGASIAVCLTALGFALAFWGYSHMLSVTPAAEQTAKALVEALEKAKLRTTVTGTMSLAPNTELKLASGQTVRLQEGAIVTLDPKSSVRVIGELKMPQPSAQQLQLDTTSKSDELAFTSYTIFRTVSFGSGVVETGWSYDLSDTLRPKYQYCYYRQNFDKGLVGRIPIASDGSPHRPSSLVKLSFDFDQALSNCIWFSGY